MKKPIITLMILLVLVSLSSSLFGQSTPAAPWEGAIHTYRVNGLTPGDTYTFGINQSNTAFSNVAGSATTYTVLEASMTGTIGASGVVQLKVLWNVGSAAQQFYIWISILDADGCYTYRYLPVNPVTAPPYDVYYNVLALTTGDENTTPATITGTAGGTNITDVCPGFVGEDWESTTEGAGTATDGSTYVYFRITRASTSLPNAPWEIRASSTTSGPSITWAASTDLAVSFNTFTIGNLITNINTGNVIYVRVTLPNATTAQAITLSIANGNDILQTTEIVHYTNGSATITVDPLPTVGSFDLSD